MEHEDVILKESEFGRQEKFVKITGYRLDEETGKEVVDLTRYIGFADPLARDFLVVTRGQFRFMKYGREYDNGDCVAPTGVSSGEVAYALVNDDIQKVRETEFDRYDKVNKQYHYKVVKGTEFRDGAYLRQDTRIIYDIETAMVREVYVDEERISSFRNGVPLYETKIGSEFSNRSRIIDQIESGNLDSEALNERLYSEIRSTMVEVDGKMYQVIRDIPRSEMINQINIRIFDSNSEPVAVVKLDSGVYKGMLGKAKESYHEGINKLEGYKVYFDVYDNDMVDLMRNSFPGRVIQGIVAPFKDGDDGLSKNDIHEIIRKELEKIAENEKKQNMPDRSEVPGHLKENTYRDVVRSNMWLVVGGVAVIAVLLLTLVNAVKNPRYYRAFRRFWSRTIGSVNVNRGLWKNIAYVLENRQGLSKAEAKRLAKKLVAREAQAGIFVAGKRPEVEHLFKDILKLFKLEESDPEAYYNFKRAPSFDGKVAVLKTFLAVERTTNKLNKIRLAKIKAWETALNNFEHNVKTLREVEKLEKRRDGRVVRDRLTEEGFGEDEINYVVEAYEGGKLSFKEIHENYYNRTRV
ncbi:MAG: hypothetical protein KAJ37_09515, partial [Candidatus Krumholzibacteria bacterium]|nr:hypothetical protein [Candidatus Krumholzibacteria bacterium]